MEGGAAAAALAWVGDGFSGGVVVVAELFLAKAWAGAAVAVGEDVAALVLFGFVCGVWHGGSPVHGQNVYKVFKRKDLRPDFSGAGLVWVKGEGPAFGQAAFFYLFLF